MVFFNTKISGERCVNCRFDTLWYSMAFFVLEPFSPHSKLLIIINLHFIKFYLPFKNLLKFYLDIRKKDKNSLSPLYLSINHKSSTAYINLGIRLEDSQWNGTEVVKHQYRQFLNMTINQKRLDIEKRLIELTNGRGLSGLNAVQIKRIIESTDESNYKIMISLIWFYKNT